MSDVSRGEGWWQASDLAWYPPDLRPGQQAAAPARRATPETTTAPPPAPGASTPLPRKAVPRKAAGKPVESSADPPAPAAPAAPSTEVLLELRGSALTSDFNRIGERLAIYADRVEQFGRGNKQKAVLPIGEVLIVEVEKTIKGSWLRVVGESAEILQQGLEPAPAEQARDLILEHAPAAVTGEVADQLRKLLELRNDGVLSAEEFAAKRQQVLGR